MALKLKINNLNKRKRLNPVDIKKCALRVMRYFGKNSALIDITFVRDKKIKDLNAKYLKKNMATDTISFLLGEKPAGRRSKIIGDIYVSSDMACYNATRFGSSFQNEVKRYVVHGLLHLLGFRDKTKKEKERMNILEERFLKDK